MTMEKYIKVKFNEAELEVLNRNASLSNKSVNKYIHDCAMETEIEISPVYSAFEVSSVLSEVRNALNEIIVKETSADIRLYEDDVIEMDKRLNDVEVAIAHYLSTVRKGLK